MIDQIYRNILDTLDAYIVMVNDEGKITYTNQAWVDLAVELGSSTDVSWLGKSYFDCCSILQIDSKRFKADYQREFEAMLQGAKNEFVIEFPSSTLDEKVWLKLTANLIEYNQTRYVLLNHTNVIERKNADEEIQSLTLQDPDTGLANVKGFKAFYENEWQRSMRSRSPVGLLVSQLDAVPTNDQDSYLVAEVFSSHARRACDLACVLKDNQFALVLGQISNISCDMIASDIYNEISLLNLQGHDGSQININIGFSSTTPTLIDHSDMLFNAATMALDKAKTSTESKITSHCPTIVFKPEQFAKG
ncbi:MAG: diguanylate cyclase [Oceanospirillaceae bacterium]|nr:diguanylate cyclase [Oceanospirillaceae bacterium]